MMLSIFNKISFPKLKKDTSVKYPDITEPEFWEIHSRISSYTMTDVERMYALYNSVKYILANNINGDFVECGVWRGGSSMMMAMMLINRNITNRKIYLFDTFEGMNAPTEKDYDFYGNSANKLLEQSVDNKQESVWCLASYEEVVNNMKSTGYNEDNIILIKGKVEDTIHSNLSIENISLLRLDTDWYESTKHELIHLYPKLTDLGVLIIDDYGHWEGCRKAVDEYFHQQKINPFFHRIDYTGRISIKIPNK